MGASEYLSTKSEIGSTKKTPIKAAIYTGLMYIFTVLVLITPYLMLTNVYLCLGISLVSGVLLIVIFTYYQSVVKNFPFKRRFIEMAAISLGIAVISFFIGYFVRIAFNVEI
ncbi:MAG: VIT1/CCC1 transporter family protein [Candidatus Helarchaeota archaeon]